MLPQIIDPQTQAQRALAKVYALLVRLADDEAQDNEKTADSDNLGKVALSTRNREKRIVADVADTTY